MWRSSALGHRAGGRWMSAYHAAFFFRLESIVCLQVNSNIAFLVLKLYPPRSYWRLWVRVWWGFQIGRDMPSFPKRMGEAEMVSYPPCALKMAWEWDWISSICYISYVMSLVSMKTQCTCFHFHSCWPSLERWFSIARWKDGKSLRFCPDLTNYYRTVYILFQNGTGRYGPYMREIVALFQWLVVFHWPVEHCISCSVNVPVETFDTCVSICCSHRRDMTGW
jgi:hypothetical protein